MLGKFFTLNCVQDIIIGALIVIVWILELYFGSNWQLYCHLLYMDHVLVASQVVLVIKDPPANAGDMRRGFDPWIGRVSWRRAWQPTPVFLPGESLWTEEPGRLQSIGSHRVGYDWSNLACHINVLLNSLYLVLGI